MLIFICLFLSCRESEKNTCNSSRDGRESVATVVTNSSNSSSNDTLKCHGSMGDLSSTYSTLPCVPDNGIATQATSVSSTGATLNGTQPQVKYDVVHSSKVPPVERHNSECILFYGQNKNAKVKHGNSWINLNNKS